MSNTKRFYYFGNTNLAKNHGGILTICCDFTDETKKYLKLGYSFCSNADIYNKKLGKQIAENRMNDRPNGYYSFPNEAVIFTGNSKLDCLKDLSRYLGSYDCVSKHNDFRKFVRNECYKLVDKYRIEVDN